MKKFLLPLLLTVLPALRGAGQDFRIGPEGYFRNEGVEWTGKPASTPASPILPCWRPTTCSSYSQRRSC